MNFAIFDNELHSLDLATKLTSEFYHVKLITSNPLTSTKISPSSFLSIVQSDITIANNVIQHLSKHDNDPFNAILLFNISSLTSMRNILQSMERFNRDCPHLFLVFINEQPDEKFRALLQQSSDTLPWTMIFCNEINTSPSSSRAYQVRTSLDQQPVNVDHFLNFLHDQIRTKKFLHQTVFLS